MKILHRIVIACLLALPFISYYLNSTPGTQYASPNIMLLAENRYKKNTCLVKDIYHGNTPSGVSFFFDLNGTLFFRGSDGTKEGLWTSDGTKDGTVFVKDISPGVDSSIPDESINTNNPLFFSANHEPSHH
jgi:ELWxxDGT repeat protein